MSGAGARILVLGLGNPDRGDDGIGPIVAGQLAGRLPAGVALAARHGDPLALIDNWAGFDALVCIDAAAPMGSPGRIHRIDPATDTLPYAAPTATSHAFGLAETVALARVLGCAPARIVIYAVEGEGFSCGADMTPAVAAAAEDAAARVLAEVRFLAAAAVAVAA